MGYIESMEYNLSMMMNEIQEMYAEVNRLHDGTKAEDKIQRAKLKASITKVKLIDAAGNAVKGCKEKGKSALRQTVEAMQVSAGQPESRQRRPRQVA